MNVKDEGISGQSLPVDFNWVSYLLQNFDIIAAGLCSEEKAIKHFIFNGAMEGRAYRLPDTPKEGGIPKAAPVFLFYHVYCGNDWKEVFQEQMDMVKDSGLYEILDKIFINLVGSDEDLVYVEQHSPQDKRVLTRVSAGYEFSTMDIISDQSQSAHFKGVYIHTKAVTYPTETWQKEVYSFWRQMMNHHILLNWRDCHRLIQRHDVVGSLFRQGNIPTEVYWQSHSEKYADPRHMKFTDHFSGNFFWFDSRYFAGIPNLSPSQREVRFNAEWLPFRNHPDKCNIFFDLSLWKSRMLELLGGEQL